MIQKPQEFQLQPRKYPQRTGGVSVGSLGEGLQGRQSHTSEGAPSLGVLPTSLDRLS